MHELLLVNRNYAIENGFFTLSEKQSIKWSTKAMSSRKMMNMTGGKMKNTLSGTFLKKTWGSRRDLPKFSDKSFNEQWKEKNE